MQSSNVSSETQGNILKATYCKIRKHIIILLQHAMEKTTPSHSKNIGMCTYGEKIEPRQEAEQENTKSCTFVLNTLESHSIGLGGPLPVTSHTSHSLFIPSPCMHLILADLSIPYVSQHFWSQNAT